MVGKRQHVRNPVVGHGWRAARVAHVLVLGAGLWASVGSGVHAAAEPRRDVRAAAAGSTRPGAATRPTPPRRDRDRPQAVLAADDWTFRPTVVVRSGSAQGSGTIIASIDGEALVLTAAHVVQEPGPIVVELHRYNLGLERTPPAPGAWPRPMGARLAAMDRAADLAILRIEQIGSLPYVARLAAGQPDPGPNSVVTSIGIDLGTKLSSWSSRLVETLWFELNDSQDERFFLITARAPEHGRSGGGLFLPGGELVGVCIGHAELVRGRRMGVFASWESVRQLLLDHHLAAVIARSELHRARLGRAPGWPANARDPANAPTPVTPTRAMD